ncbi:MAG: AmiS/UreI family transporter [Deltaproteobacteria bacterium]|nr:AmiS/UreI family transporter [Deltaproteobacteria bacterium]
MIGKAFKTVRVLNQQKQERGIMVDPGLYVAFLLFFVGWIFCLNGLTALNLVGTKEAGVWNLVISAMMFIWVIYFLGANLIGKGTIWFAAQVLLFAFTYLFLGLNYLLGTDARGLGWYCLWVSLVTPVVSYQNFMAGDPRFGAIWAIWGVLWFLFWVILGLGKTSVMNKVKYLMVPTGVLTAWIPGLLMFIGKW